MTTVEQVRLLIGDTAAPQHFTDAQLQEFLTLAGDSVYLASALALKSWAAYLSGELEGERIGDYSYTRGQVANKLKLAENYEKLEATIPAFDWAEMDLAGTLEEDE